MNVKRLCEVAAYIKEEPQRFIMGDGVIFTGENGEYLDENDGADFTVKPPCGTAACIAGTAVLLAKKASKTMAGLTCNGIYRISWSYIVDEADTLLGLNFEQSERLFKLYGWTKKNRVRFTTAGTHQERVDAAVDEIEVFIAENTKNSLDTNENTT